MIRTEIGDYSEGRVLYTELSAWKRILTSNEFHVVVNKGRPVTGADPHSVAFGKAVNDFELSMRSLVFTLQHRRSIDSRDQAARTAEFDSASRCIADAKQYAKLAVSKVFDSVVDENVLRQILFADSDDRGRLDQIATARAKLQRVRGAIVGSIWKM